MSSSPTFCLSCSREQGEPVEAGSVTDREALEDEYDLDKKSNYILFEHKKCGERAVNPMFSEEDVEEYLEAMEILSQDPVGSKNLELNEFTRDNRRVV